MFDWLKRLFQRKPVAGNPLHDDALARRWDEHKSRLLEQALGKEHDIVMHAIIPYAIGGALDLYYYPNGIPGTAIATKELSEFPDEGSSNECFQTYELVMFTKHALDLKQARDPATAFGAAHQNMNRILNMIARYSGTAELNPGETCEFPAEMEDVGGKCLIFDQYGLYNDELARSFGLLLVMEIFRSELAYKTKRGGEALLQLLKDAGHYPYADLERPPVA